MEDFYPFKSEDIPELSLLVKEPLADKDIWGQERKENAISFLVPLIVDLLEDAGTSRALKKTFHEELKVKGKSEAKISNGFWKIVEAYLEENNGTGNLLRITEVLNANDHEDIANPLEKFLARYSLPASSEGSGLSDSANSYSLSRDFLHAEKKGEGESVLLWNANSMEQALQNSVIIEEIFKKMHIGDKKLFRLVSPAWMEETFSFWRKNTRIFIQVTKEERELTRGISLPAFLDLLEKNKKNPMEEANANENEEQRGPAIEDIENYKLQDNPFRSYRVIYHSGMDLFSSVEREKENKFWQICGHNIEELKISGASCKRIIENYKRLLQDTCPSLKRLEVSCPYKYFTRHTSSSSEKTEKDQVKLEFKGDADKKMKIAENLRTLILEDLDEESLKTLLFICPNLKELTINVGMDDLLVGALLSPVANGEFIKLEKLCLQECSFIFDDFIYLRQYFEMLVRTKFESFEHFELITPLLNARSPSFNLYAALAQVSKNLKTLKLDLFIFNGDEVDDKLDWFMDLSPFAFPNLTKLNFVIDFEHVNGDFKTHPKFDLGTLKGMPMLEKLKISTRNYPKEMLRKAGAQDWVFEGDRNKYLPTGVIVDYQYSAEDPLLCNNLKEFKFDAWSLNEEDIILLSGWFPNLTYLEAEVNPGALPVLAESWPRLEKLVITTEKLVSLRKLRPLKEKKNQLRIFQRILSYDDINELIELKEYNCWLFYEIFREHPKYY